MNKTEVVSKVSEKTGMSAEVCQRVMDALEQVSGNILLTRMKGVKLDESEAVEEITGKANLPETDCKAILAAFEETFGEAISDKFRFFKKQDRKA